MNPISSHSISHTLYPNIIVKPPGTPCVRAQAENSIIVSQPKSQYQCIHRRIS